METYQTDMDDRTGRYIVTVLGTDGKPAVSENFRNLSAAHKWIDGRRRSSALFEKMVSTRRMAVVAMAFQEMA